MVLYFRFFLDLPFILYFTPRGDTAGPWRRIHTRGRWNNRHDRTKVYRSVKVQTSLCTTFGSQSLNFTRWINCSGKERQISRLIIQLKNAMFIEIFHDKCKVYYSGWYFFCCYVREFLFCFLTRLIKTYSPGDHYLPGGGRLGNTITTVLIRRCVPLKWKLLEREINWYFLNGQSNNIYFLSAPTQKLWLQP